MANESTSKSFFYGVLLGGVAGVLVGLLFAPKSGKELRKDICSESKELAQEAGEEVKELAERGKEGAKHMAGEAKEKLKEGFQKVKGDGL